MSDNLPGRYNVLSALTNDLPGMRLFQLWQGDAARAN